MSYIFRNESFIDSSKFIIVLIRKYLFPMQTIQNKIFILSVPCSHKLYFLSLWECFPLFSAKFLIFSSFSESFFLHCSKPALWKTCAEYCTTIEMYKLAFVNKVSQRKKKDYLDEDERICGNSKSLKIMWSIYNRHTRFILKAQLSWNSSKFQLARWATKWLYLLTEPSTWI